MLSYWQSHVAEHFLPPVSEKRKLEVEQRKLGNEPIKAKKEKVRSASVNKNRTQESIMHQNESTMKGQNQMILKAYISEDNYN